MSHTEPVPESDSVKILTPDPVSDKSKHGKRLGRPAIQAILSLAEVQRPVTEIAKQFGVSRDTVHRILRDFQDTRVLARKRLKAGSLELAERVIRKARPKEAVQVLEDLRVLTPAQPGPSGNQVNVLVLGMRQVPADIPVINTQALSPAKHE